ncbi:Oxidoreductase molybdopterin binding domain-containing protein [Streptomyces sp. DvalAA-14]|uniref:molybdopterin-dependent oxidoreductase n=2 Tax=unclassified Streptomyces TaxID=2593676 RepID=UPI00081BC3E7|nr:molybdopterin-dependent oxidoreductase [Streptomyces sp. SID4948]SCD32211.1 Oxidoreductase molybdopterin binding domain-containing protein [Streptomyces sp. DvalAA-14]
MEDRTPRPVKTPVPLSGADAKDSADPEEQKGGSPVGRRLVLGMLGLGAAGVAVGGGVQDKLDTILASVTTRDPTGVTSLLPGGGGFRFYSVSNSIPHRGEADYRLTIGGLVDKPVTYRLSDLRALPQVRMVRDVQCVTGWRVPKTAFSGVRLSTLLDAAGVQDKGAALRFTCFDGVYSESLTLDQARRSDMLVALTMNDKPVTDAHGGPVRLYAAPMYFYKSAKWLSGITVTKDVEPGYWEHYGYDVDGWVGKSNGRHDDPTS